MSSYIATTWDLKQRCTVIPYLSFCFENLGWILCHIRCLQVRLNSTRDCQDSMEVFLQPFCNGHFNMFLLTLAWEQKESLWVLRFLGWRYRVQLTSMSIFWVFHYSYYFNWCLYSYHLSKTLKNCRVLMYFLSVSVFLFILAFVQWASLWWPRLLYFQFIYSWLFTRKHIYKGCWLKLRAAYFRFGTWNRNK